MSKCILGAMSPCIRALDATEQIIQGPYVAEGAKPKWRLYSRLNWDGLL
jgi:hypothetical protein